MSPYRINLRGREDIYALNAIKSKLPTKKHDIWLVLIIRTQFLNPFWDQTFAYFQDEVLKKNVSSMRRKRIFFPSFFGQKYIQFPILMGQGYIEITYF